MNPSIFSTGEIAQLRAATPGTTNVIHLNNAGASLPTNEVLNAVTAYLTEEALNGGYETEAKYQQQLDETYTLIGRLINARPEEIALVENASAAWCMAFYGIDFQPGDEILISELEYVTNMIGFLNAERLFGVRTVLIPNDEQGNFSLEQLEAAIGPRTKLIAVTHVASATGGILPATEIGSIAARHGILYLLDACQSVGQLPVDVKEIGCDFMSVTGRKYLRAPRGTGFLYIKHEIQDKLKALFIDGHSIDRISETDFQLRKDAKQFELYEKNRALTLGLAGAVSYALNIGMDRIWQRISDLAGFARLQLQQIPGLTVHDSGDHLCGIITFSLKGMDCTTVKQYLSAQNINVSVGLAKSTLLFMNKHQLQSVVRASVHYYNTEAEIETFCRVIAGLR